MLSLKMFRNWSLALIASTNLFAASPKPTDARPVKPTIVLVHGAFADASSWNRVVPRLLADGYRVIAVANPLRSLATDSAYVSGIVKSIEGPVVLVGHSYGGAVISNAAVGNDNVKALVFVAGFAPEIGESAFGIVGRFPGSILGDAVVPSPLNGGGNDLYVSRAGFRASFAADLPPSLVEVMAATQRPITDAAGNEPSAAAAWKTLPSWFIYGDADRSIAPAAHAFMANRARARLAVEIRGASHVIMLSHPADVLFVIRQAANQYQGVIADAK